ncbi:MAG: DUF4157 domain-containing protein [Bacteroidales bacterium]|nr:DUF4157 domain-containing protein [Bacteroidales bacterium]
MISKPEIRQETKGGKGESWKPAKVQLSGLKISNKNDKQEQEADAVADRVMLMPSNKQQDIAMAGSPKAALHLSTNHEQDTLTLQENESEKDDSLQLMPDIHLQEMAGNPDDSEDKSTIATKIDSGNGSNSLQLKEEDTLDMQTEEEDTSKISLKSADSEEEIDRTAEDDDKVQLKEDEDKLNLQENEDKESDLNMQEDVISHQEAAPDDEDEDLQLKRIQSKDGSNYAPSDVQNKINRTKGQGNSLPDTTQSDLGSKMGADFSNVKVHNDGEASGMNSQLGAKAFTHGTDIYFKSGEYNPGSSQGKRLLAHELTHTVQQGGAPSVQTKEASENITTAAPKESVTEQTDAAITSQEANVEPTARPAPAQETSTGQTSPAAETTPKTSPAESVAEETTKSKSAEGKQAAGTSNVGEVQQATLSETTSESGEQQTSTISTEKDKEGPQDITKADPSKSAGAAQSAEKEEITTDKEAKKEGKDKKKIEGKSPQEFQEEGKTADKENVVPQNTKPHKDKAFQGAMHQTEKAKQSQGAHAPSVVKLGETIMDAQLPVEQQDKKNAQLGHIGKMDGIAKTKKKKKQPFTPDKFKKVLDKHLKELEKQLPNSKGAAKNFKRKKPIDKIGKAISSDVKKENVAITGPMAAEAQQKNPPPSTVKAIEAKPIPDDKVGPQPRPISPGSAVPKKKNDSELSMQKESQSLDDYMAENKVTEEQLAKSNEPTFIEALGKKKQAQKAASDAPKESRSKENSTLKRAKQSAYATSKKGQEGMHGARKDAFTNVLTGQKNTSKDDQSKQKKIFKDLETIYNNTKKDVTKKLDDLSESVDTIFSAQSKIATIIFENNVESRLDDIYGITVIDDWLFGEDTEGIEQAFRIEKARFIKTINGVLNDLAKLIAKRLNEAITIIENGRKKSDGYFKTLSKEEQKLATDAFDDFNDQYNSLEESVHDKEKEIAQSLARAYNENVKSLRAKFDKIKKRVSAGWIGAAFNFIAGIVKAILKIKDLLLNLLSAAISAIGAIISDPIGFLSNLINGIKQGFANFGKNLLSNIMTGLIEWLTGSMGGLQIKIPKDLFSLSGIFSLVTQILGLTWDYFRAKAVKLVGEPLVKMMETGIEVFKIVRQKGVEGLWGYIKEQFANLKEMVMDAIRDMIITKVIEAGIKWILGLMSPAGAFIKAAMMIVDIVRFFIERASQIFELVQAFIDGIRALANGNVASVAKAIERALVKAIPVLIGFLAALVGITGLTGKIQKIIKRVRGKIDRAITKIIKKAKKAFGKLVKKGKGTYKKVKKKAKKAVGKFIKWWTAKKTFKAKDGEKHKLYFKGKKGKLMVASDPMEVDKYLSRNASTLSKNNPGAFKNAQNLVKKLEKLASQASKIPNVETSKNKNKLKKINSQITKTIDSLSNVMIYLMGTKPTPPTSPKWKFQAASWPGYPKMASVHDLSKNTAKGGSKPGANNAGWPYVKAQPDMTNLWVRMHLVSEKLGGKGGANNLVPGPKTTNSQMEQYAENPLKKVLGKSQSKPKEKIKHDSVVWVITTVDYHNTTTENAGQTYHWANRIKVEGGFHFYDANSNDWKKNASPVYSRSFPVPLPKGAATKRLNMNSASRVDMLELDFKKAGIKRVYFKSALDQSFDKFAANKPYSNFSDFNNKMRSKYTLRHPDGKRTKVSFLISDIKRLNNKKLITWG